MYNDLREVPIQWYDTDREVVSLHPQNHMHPATTSRIVNQNVYNAPGPQTYPNSNSSLQRSQQMEHGYVTVYDIPGNPSRNFPVGESKTLNQANFTSADYLASSHSRIPRGEVREESDADGGTWTYFEPENRATLQGPPPAIVDTSQHMRGQPLPSYSRTPAHETQAPIPSHWENTPSKPSTEKDVTANDFAIAQALSCGEVPPQPTTFDSHNVQQRSYYAEPTPSPKIISEYPENMGAGRNAGNEERTDRHLAVLLEAKELGLGVGDMQLSEMEQEVKRRLSRIESIPHTMKVNSEDIPSLDVSSRNHELLNERLFNYGLRERNMAGDGNCQFRALSDQLFGTPERHTEVRRDVKRQLQSHRQDYQAHIPEDFDKYVKKMAKNGEWGDHVTLQAAADFYSAKIFLLTSYPENFLVQIVPRDGKIRRELWLSFWAEVHYNSIYAVEDLPNPTEQKKKHWIF